MPRSWAKGYTGCLSHAGKGVVMENFPEDKSENVKFERLRRSFQEEPEEK